MKITARKSANNLLTVNIEAFVDHPFFHDEYFSNEIVATYNPKDFSLPTRPVIAKDKERIKSWMVDDFEAFVSDIEMLCEVNYNLVLTYTSASENHSHYYNYLAKDSEGNAIAKFRLRLRISNHSPKRSPSQKHNKKEELMSEKLHELLSEKDISKLRAYTKIITVNDSYYDSYEQAFDDIDQILEDAVSKMTRRHN